MSDVNGNFINDMKIDVENIESVNAMNKIMHFMANCGYSDIKKLVFDVFDSAIANHILYKYDNQLKYTKNSFFNIYFEVDNDCKKKICEYILKYYSIEHKLI